MKIGVIGLGRMGAAIAESLAASQHSVTAFDRDPARGRAVEGQRVTIASSPAAVVRASEIVLSSITNDAAVNSLFRDSDGILTVDDIDGKLFIEMSTVQPATVHALNPILAERGARIIDAPVLGSVPSVRAGTLLVLAGGDTADIERASMILGALARRIVHIGPVGTGYAMKLAVNLTMAAYLQSLAEGLALGARYGLEMDLMLDIFGEAPTANPWLASKLGVLKGGPVDTTLDIRTLRKDIMCALATGANAGIPMPVASGVLACLSAAVAGGHGQQDLGELPRFVRDHMVQADT
jgi:3-hydroxyisobutyrate dehydrogenase